MFGNIPRIGLLSISSAGAINAGFKLDACTAFFCACLLGMLPWSMRANSADSGWLYVLDPRIELQISGSGEVKNYEIAMFGRSPGVTDEMLDFFSGTLSLNTQKQWTDGTTLVVDGTPGDHTLRVKLTAQGRENWSARKRNFYSGKEWDTLKLVTTGVLPGITGEYENARESGPNFDEYLRLRETPCGVWFDLEFAMADEELVDQFARRVSEDTFIFKSSASGPEKNRTLSEMQIRLLYNTTVNEQGAEPMAYKVVLNANNRANLNFPWNRIEERIYRKLAPGGISSRAFRLHSKPLNSSLIDALKKIETAHDLFKAGSAEADALLLNAATQLGGGIGLAQALADRWSDRRRLVAAIRNAALGVDFGLETLWHELGWTYGDLYIDPDFVLKMYRTAGVNPEESHASQWELMRIVIEAGPFDLNAFLVTHHLKVEDLRASPYAIWELAKEASIDGRFGKANARLALQLVSRGGGNVEEREAAIRQCHSILIGKRTAPFEPRECIRSRLGAVYMLSGTAKLLANPVQVAASLSTKFANDNLRSAFAKAFDAAERFAEQEAAHYSGCRGFFTWESNRRAYKKSVLLGFIDEVQSVLAGKISKINEASRDSEATLEELTKNLHTFMKGPRDYDVKGSEDPAPGDSFYFAEGEEIELQSTWKSYRDALSELLYAIDSERAEHEWKECINRRRLDFLTRLKSQSQ